MYSASFFVVAVFLSTPSGWRATEFIRQKAPEINISIHALRVEGDNICAEIEELEHEFLSTPSGWRATPALV